jgi:SAM-dependent methyltransferase
MSDKAKELQEEYRLRFDKTTGYRDAVWKILCDVYFSKLIPPEAHVLDLGCGWGEFINNIKAAEKYAMDLNPDTGSRLSEGIRFIGQDCAQEWPLKTGSLDVVFTSNFLEHLPDKGTIERCIAETYRCLKDGGLIICLGPNVKHVPAAYWDFWDHLIPLTDLSVCELLKMKGFSIRTSLSRFLPYSMSTGKTPPLYLVKLYLKLPVLWPLFGKQFLTVGRKGKAA